MWHWNNQILFIRASSITAAVVAQQTSLNCHYFRGQNYSTLAFTPIKKNIWHWQHFLYSWLNTTVGIIQAHLKENWKPAPSCLHMDHLNDFFFGFLSNFLDGFLWLYIRSLLQADQHVVEGFLGLVKYILAMILWCYINIILVKVRCHSDDTKLPEILGFCIMEQLCWLGYLN